jgi:hypothetical protein
MAITPQKFNAFVEALAEKKHNLGSDSLKLMLTNTAPLSTHAVKADITEIGAGNGYSAGGAAVTVASSSQTGGLYKLVINDVVITAAGGSIGPFRWAVLYNDTAPSKELIWFLDYGLPITLPNGEYFKVDGTSAGALSLQ